MGKRKTDHIAARGKNLVANGFDEHLEWTARDELRDDGIDLNVQIPFDQSELSERFLIQVKTASKWRDLKDGDWSYTLNVETCKKYLLTTEVIFLFGVDLSRGEIRWVNLSEQLQRKADQQTFHLPNSHRLDDKTWPAFAKVAREAIAVRKDHLRPPSEALKYRIRQLLKTAPGFEVTSYQYVKGAEHYALMPAEGTNLQFTFSPKTLADSRTLRRAIDFGMPAEIRLRHFDFNGIAFPPPEADRTRVMLKIQPRTRNVRLHIAVPEIPNNEIELDTVLMLGAKGFQLSSVDKANPFRFTLRGLRSGQKLTFKPQVSFQQWDGRRLAALTMPDRLFRFMQALQQGCHVAFSVVEQGERVQLLSADIPARSDADLQEIVQQLDFISALVRLCQTLDSASVFDHSIEPSPEQLKDLQVAFQLVDGLTLPCNVSPFHLNVPPERRHLVPADPASLFIVRQTMHLKFGASLIGDLPIKTQLKEAVFRALGNGEFEIARTMAEMTQDLPGKS
jgi:hypothetical protein